MTVAIILVNSISCMVCAIYISWFLSTIKIHFLPECTIMESVYFKITSKVVFNSLMFKPNIQKSTNNLAYNNNRIRAPSSR